MKTWLNLVALRWLTGRDGLPAFWKIAHLGLFTIYAFVVYETVRQPGFLANLWPLMWWSALLMAASFGMKGLEIWFSHATLNVTGSVNTQVSADLTKITEAVFSRRAKSDHPQTEATP